MRSHPLKKSESHQICQISSPNWPKLSPSIGAATAAAAAVRILNCLIDVVWHFLRSLDNFRHMCDVARVFSSFGKKSDGTKVAQLAFMPHCVDLMSCKLCQVYQTTDGSITN